MGDTKACPFCAETIQAAAVICKFCRSRLDGGSSDNPDRAHDESRAKEKAQAIHTGAVPAAPPPPGPVSSSTWTSLVVMLVLAIPGILAHVLGNGNDTEGCLVISLVFAGFAAIFVVAYLIQDLVGPSPRQRPTPEAAAKAFYAMLKRRQYGRAWACLSPLDRTVETHATTELARLSVERKEFPFSPKKPFGKYWRKQCGLDDKGLGGYHKSLKYEILGTRKIRPGVAEVHVRLRVGGYPSIVVLAVFAGVLIAVILMLVLRREETFEVRKIVHEKDGQWWIASGEFGDGEDAFLAEMLREKG